jgi:hypothetical protein
MIKNNYKLSNWIHDDLVFVSNKFINKKWFQLLFLLIII